MDILTRIEFHSKVCPGVVATFRRTSAASRARYLDSMGAYRARARELRRARKPLDDQYQAAIEKARAAAKVEVDRLIEAQGVTREAAEQRVQVRVNFSEFEQWAEQTEEINRLESNASDWCGLRSVLVSIQGYTLAGKEPTAEELIAEAPLELTDELAKAAGEISTLSPIERGESPWPGISAKAAAGPNPSTTAAPAASEQEQS
jgi:hypothetical protein